MRGVYRDRKLPQSFQPAAQDRYSAQAWGPPQPLLQWPPSMPDNHFCGPLLPQEMHDGVRSPCSSIDRWLPRQCSLPYQHPVWHPIQTDRCRSWMQLRPQKNQGAIVLTSLFAIRFRQSRPALRSHLSWAFQWLGFDLQVPWILGIGHCQESYLRFAWFHRHRGRTWASNHRQSSRKTPPSHRIHRVFDQCRCAQPPELPHSCRASHRRWWELRYVSFWYSYFIFEILDWCWCALGFDCLSQHVLSRWRDSNIWRRWRPTHFLSAPQKLCLNKDTDGYK